MIPKENLLRETIFSTEERWKRVQTSRLDAHVTSDSRRSPPVDLINRGSGVGVGVGGWVENTASQFWWEARKRNEITERED